MENDAIAHNKLIEKICRKICDKNGLNPDTLVCKMVPEFINPGYLAGYVIPNSSFQMPAWNMFRDVAQASYEIINEQFWLKTK